MYKYEFDSETGGILLTYSELQMSKEPRPVFAEEMNILGFDKHWNYENQNDIPYLWAEANNYFYRGKKIATVKGGSLYEKPKFEIAKSNGISESETLLPVDIKGMCEKNFEIVEILRQTTMQRIYNYWQRMKKRVDCFYVAFSGGKDSIVLLDLVKHALPGSSFMVMFGDTRMEVPDTYNLVSLVEKQCNKECIGFYRSASKILPEESWKLFGAPSRHLRWCCSVHKSAPQVLRIREILDKPNFVGSAFVGVRAQESLSRSSYDVENFGEKLRGQYAHHSILEWSSAEIWLYIFMYGLPINGTYKKGNSRAGCLFCPMTSPKNNFFKMQSYGNEVNAYINLAKSALNQTKVDDSYIRKGAWITRRSGRDLENAATNYSEEIYDGYLYIKVTKPKSNWHEWIKTLGDIELPYEVQFDSPDDEVIIKVKSTYNKTPIMKMFKSVFHKAASCVGCKVCESNCSQGAISFANGVIQIDEKKCCHCLQCHSIPNSCYCYDSTRVVKSKQK